MALRLLACNRSPASTAVSATLTIAGSTSVQPFAEKWAEQYMEKHPNTLINVQGGGSTAGVRAAETGTAQIGSVSRDLKAEESSLRAIVVARDAIAVVVNPQNPIAGLSTQQVRDIFSGATQSWKQVGGPDRPITAISREEGSGTRTAFEEMVMKKTKINSGALVQDSTGAVRELVRSDPSAIGYISLGQLTPQLKALPLDGVAPTEANAVSGKYPLVRPFLFVVRGDPTGVAKDFIDFVCSAEGQTLARHEGLVPIK